MLTYYVHPGKARPTAKVRVIALFRGKPPMLAYIAVEGGSWMMDVYNVGPIPIGEPDEWRPLDLGSEG
jgi:hypothetical protein